MPIGAEIGKRNVLVVPSLKSSAKYPVPAVSRTVTGVAGYDWLVRGPRNRILSPTQPSCPERNVHCTYGQMAVCQLMSQ